MFMVVHPHLNNLSVFGVILPTFPRQKTDAQLPLHLGSRHVAWALTISQVFD